MPPWTKLDTVFLPKCLNFIILYFLWIWPFVTVHPSVVVCPTLHGSTTTEENKYCLSVFVFPWIRLLSKIHRQRALPCFRIKHLALYCSINSSIQSALLARVFDEPYSQSRHIDLKPKHANTYSVHTWEHLFHSSDSACICVCKWCTTLLMKVMCIHPTTSNSLSFSRQAAVEL